MTNGKRLGAALTALVVLSARPAQAAPEHFAARGQVVLDQRMALSGSYSRASTGPGALAPFGTTTFSLAPSASYFVLAHLSLGLQVELGRSWTSQDASTFHYASTTLGASPSVGYGAALSEHWLLWPQLSVRYSKTWATGVGQNGHSELTSSGAQAWVPVLWQPAEHFFCGVGPSVVYRRMDYDGSPFESWGIGVGTLIGGYFSP